MFDDDLTLARELAIAAADVAMAHFRSGVSARRKADGSALTDADLAVEATLLETLANRRPADAVLSEERGAIGAASRRWIVDPIDGTSFFAAGRADQWGTQIALEIDAEIVLGVISRPASERIWWAKRGGGAHRGSLRSPTPDATLRVSKVVQLRQSTFAYWAEEDDERRRRDVLGAEARLVAATKDCVQEVAEGSLELAICGASAPWDLAPGVVIIEEAGGLFSDPEGGRRLDMGEGWYSNGKVHRTMRELLREHPRKVRFPPVANV